MTNEELAKLLERPTVSVPEICDALRIAPNTAYKGVHGGDIPSIKVCNTYRVPTTWLRSKLGL
jgi:hypothetical protein